MADFALIHENEVVPVHINLDYVVRIDRGLDPDEPTTVRFINGDLISLKRAEGDELVAQLNRCCRPLEDNPEEKSTTGSKTLAGAKGRTTSSSS